MIEIDGTAGGGQLLRTALSLSTVTGTPFRIEDVRATRPEPGLRAQHLAAVRLVADLCEAAVEGAELGSDSLTFRPGDGRRTSLRADVGTAGSVTLLFDTVLPVAATMDDAFLVTATGGTDVKWAPTIEYYRRVKLPLLADAGVDAAVDLARTGFYPAGGGEATLRTTPASPAPIELEARGALERVEVYSKAAESLEERRVADRQADHARDRLEDAGVPTEVASVEYVPARSPGSSLLLRGVYERSLAGFDALGERGRTSEAVADGAVREFTAFHAGDAPVDPYMADQVMVFLALAGGRVRVPTVTAHVRANLDLLDAFGSDLRLVRRGDGTATLTASAHPAVR
ncbi:RNA 3'-terminal phosphate cyclase [Halorarum salinum]|uniref:RNA 3'-terminal phosphate cyclase n=2 Tax=Halorarum salinum TaxID=2743089 RepID=A0A7D5LDD9_9EURY|nr:RNA 3'-terminal phosphate cyclase [Halobaculum salinum]